ncbi:hypothetical protein BDN70DRAFT_985196, partial [Pholiota conissans]
KLLRWARLHLPNLQPVRTAWKERPKPMDKVRMSRIVKFHRPDAGKHPFFAEVQYFFQAEVQEKTEALALVSTFSPPDPELAKKSSGALLVCQYRGVAALEVILAKSIRTSIAMVPYKDPRNGKFYVSEKMGLDIAFMRAEREERENT